MLKGTSSILAWPQLADDIRVKMSLLVDLITISRLTEMAIEKVHKQKLQPKENSEFPLAGNIPLGFHLTSVMRGAQESLQMFSASWGM